MIWKSGTTGYGVLDLRHRGNRMEGRAKITREVKPGIERTEDVWLEMDDPRHYGIWSDDYGRWWWRNLEVFVTTSEAVAEAQLTMIFAGTELSSPQEDLEPWRVRCIEEWADEQG